MLERYSKLSGRGWAFVLVPTAKAGRCSFLRWCTRGSLYLTCWFCSSFPPHLKKKEMAQGPPARLFPRKGAAWRRGGDRSACRGATNPVPAPGGVLAEQRQGWGRLMSFPSFSCRKPAREEKEEEALQQKHIWAATPAGVCTGEAGSSGKKRGKSAKEQFPTSLVEVNAWAGSAQVSESLAKRWRGGCWGKTQSSPTGTLSFQGMMDAPDLMALTKSSSKQWRGLLGLCPGPFVSAKDFRNHNPYGWLQRPLAMVLMPSPGTSPGPAGSQEAAWAEPEVRADVLGVEAHGWEGESRLLVPEWLARGPGTWVGSRAWANSARLWHISLFLSWPGTSLTARESPWGWSRASARSLSTVLQLTQVLPRAWCGQGGWGGPGKMRTWRQRELWKLGVLEGALLWARAWG